MLPGSPFEAHCVFSADDYKMEAAAATAAAAAEICGRQRYWGSSSQQQAAELEPLVYKNEPAGQFADFNGANSIFGSGTSQHFGEEQAASFNPVHHISESQAKQEMLAYQALCQAELFRSEKTPHRTQFQRENHILAERQRREEMNEKFSALKSLLPKSTKKDKASIVGETIGYVLELEKKLKALQTVAGTKNLHRQKRRALQVDAASQESKLTTSSNSSVQAETDLNNKTAQVELQALGAQAVVKVICMRTPGLLLRLLATLEDCKAEIVQSNIAALGSYAILYFTIELSPEANTTTEELIAALEIAASGSTTTV